MEPKNKSHEYRLLHKLGGFSKNMTNYHHLENLSEFLLHDLCSQDLFDISKAVYLVNNPDFACLKGVAGYQASEAFEHQDYWEKHQDFTRHMKQAPFNNKVRQHFDTALQIKNNIPEEKRIDQLIELFEIENPELQVWNMKHDNQGILLFNQPKKTQEHFEHMPHFASMLSFCPIF